MKQFENTRTHSMNIEIYNAHAKTLTWTHSPYNPSVQKKWGEILESA